MRNTYEKELIENILTSKQKTIYQKYQSGLTETEIARELNLSQPTVSRHINVAKDKINAILNIYDRAVEKFLLTQVEESNFLCNIEKAQSRDNNIEIIQNVDNDKKEIKLMCNDGTIEIAYIDFIDEEGNVYIERKNGKNLVIPRDIFRKVTKNVRNII